MPHLSIHLLIDLWLVSIAYLLCIELQCTWESWYISEILIPVLSGLHPEVELLYHVVVLFSMSWGISILFSIMVTSFYISTNSVEVFLFLCFLNFDWQKIPFYYFLKFNFFVLCPFRATPTAHRCSQARSLMRAVAIGLCQSHSNAISEPHLWPTPQRV